MKLHWFCLAMALACCSLTQSVQAQERIDPCKRPVPSPATGTTKLTLKDGQSVYHEGEIIPLELTFTYRLVQYRPRAGRNLRHFSFCLTPGERDPLQDDEESGLWGGAGGSFNSDYEVFDPGVPYVDNMVLNESKSVPPGNYSLRLGISNEVKFQVLSATPEWQAVKMIAAVPLLRMNLHEPQLQNRYFKTESYLSGRDLIFQNDYEKVIFRARMAASIFALLVALLAFFTASEMFGTGAGFIALALIVFEPNLLAHGALVTTDTGAAASLLAGIYAFYRYVKSPSWGRVLVLGLAAGLPRQRPAPLHSGAGLSPLRRGLLQR